MIDKDVAEAGLAALATAIGELMEDEHVAAVSRLPDSPAEVSNRFAALRQLGSDIVTLADAAAVLIRRKE